MDDAFRVSFGDLSGSSVFLACLGLASLFVLSLYAVSAGLPRSHPVTVRRRIVAIAFVCVVSPAYVWAWSTNSKDGEPLWRVLGIRSEGILWATVSPLLLVSLAYFGSFVHYASLKQNPFSDIDLTERWDITFRNYVAAPFAEEIVFRACLVPLLLPSLGKFWTIILSPLFFGLAHLHHIVEWLRTDGEREPLMDVLLGLIFQVGYTSLFGMFSAFLFVQSGHILSPVLAHSYCNILGLPPITEIHSHSHPRLLFSAYLLGLLTFILLLFPMTSSNLYN